MNMKTKLMTTLMCVLTIGVNAQTFQKENRGFEHFKRHGRIVSQIEHAAAKHDYRYRMVSCLSSDEYQLTYYFYNGNQQLVAVKDSVRNDYSLVDSLFYNELGQLVRMSGWQLLYGGWQNVYSIDYIYDEAGNLASRTNYNNFDGDWQLGGVYQYRYNAQNQITESELTMGGIVFQKVEYSYDGEGRLVQELWYGYDGSGLTPSEKIHTYYNNGLMSAEYDSITDDGQHWRFNGRTEYQYDAAGNCSKFSQYDMSDMEVGRSEYEFNTGMPLSQTLIPSSPEMVRPNVYNNVHAYVREHWYTVMDDHSLHYVCDYIYSYDNVAGIDAHQQMDALVYPNPTSDFVTVSGFVGKPCKVVVFDAMGRLVSNAESLFDNGRLDVRGLVAGCYVIQIITNDGIHTARLIKE